MVIRTVKKAVERYGVPEIITSDQGSQFTSKEYIKTYNDERGHKSHNYMTPSEIYFGISN